MKRFIKYLLVFGFFFGFSLFTFASTKTFLETVTEEKTKIETMFDTSYDVVYNNFQTSIGGFLTSLNYQGLVCLGVISDSLLLQQMQNDNKNLKIGFLNAYSTLYADSLDLEQKQRIYQDTSVYLFASGAAYETEKERILTSLAQLKTSQTNLINQFQLTYKNKINKFVTDFADYTEKNKDLLNTVGANIKIIKQVDQNYKELTSDLLNYQMQLAGSGAKFFSKLGILKQASIGGLDSLFQNTIDREIKRYKILVNLNEELLLQKDYALGLYKMQFDEKINMLLDKWYDNKEFTQITKEFQQFMSKYAPAGKMQCSSFISSTEFIQESASIFAKIKGFNDSFSLENIQTTTHSQFQDAIMKRIPVVIKLQKDIINDFKLAVNQKKQYLLDDYRKQTDPSLNISSNIDYSSSVIKSFKFTQAFKKGQFSEDIKILQQLLSKLSYYNGGIDGLYSTETIQAVYQYQLAKGLLKGYENKPQTWGWMGPATRSQLNNDLLR